VAETAVLERWQRGWSPLNLPPSDLYPQEVAGDQLVDAEGVIFTAGGEIRWGRNQFRIHGPGVGIIKTLVEFVTDDYNQLLAFVDDSGTGKLYKLDGLDWSSPSPTQWDYGYRIFSAKSWAQVTTESAAVALLGDEGAAAVVQVRNELFILVDGDTEALVWDGATLRVVGIAAPSSAPGASATTGDLPVGTYSYYYTYYDPETGQESMPSPVVDVQITTDGGAVDLSGITGAYPKRIYRAYTSSLESGARGANFQRLPTLLPAGSAAGATEDLTSGWVEKDTQARLTVTANKIAAVDLQRNDEAYVTKDEGAGNIGDFEHRLSFKPTAMEADAAVVLGGVSGVLDKSYNWSAGVSLSVWKVGGALLLELTDHDSSEVDAWGPLSLGTTYYVRWGRVGTTIYFKLYTNSDYSGVPIASRQLKDVDDTTFRYIHLMNAFGAAGNTEKGTYDITDVILQAATTLLDNFSAYSLGEEIAFDHARPPQGTILHHHGDRLFAAGCTEGSPDYEEDPLEPGYYGNVLFYTPIGEPYYWPGVNFVEVGDHSPIVGLASWRSQLLIFKETSTWVLSGYASQQFRLEVLEPNVGGLVADAVASGPSGVLWASRDGLWFYDGTSISRIVPFGGRSPWAAADVHSIAFHNNRFYARGPGDRLSIYYPERGSWTRMAWDDEDADTTTVALRAYNEGTQQAHILTRTAWKDGGAQEITVLHPVSEITNHDGEGSSHSDLYAPVTLTFLLPQAPPGYELLPGAIWVVGDWDLHGTAAYRPKLYLNDDAAYSAVAGNNAWETTPECPQDGHVIGVPNGYEYDSSARTNAARRWYLQIKGEWAKGFRLENIRVEYRLRTARGA